LPTQCILGQALYKFRGYADGAGPLGRFVHDATGNLYGTTVNGGLRACINGGVDPAGCGTVYRFNLKSGNKSPLYKFTGGLDGAIPNGSLLRDDLGVLYGSTFSGGAYNAGTVFKLDPATGIETVLYHFQNGLDGALPNAGVVGDSAGNLYGVTMLGGVTDECCGTVFKLHPNGAFRVLHRFKGQPDGDMPFGALLRDAVGNLYGTTMFGGSDNLGAVFKITPNGSEAILYSFTLSNDLGVMPESELLLDPEGNLFGTTSEGGSYNAGTVFKIDSSGQVSLIYSFTGLQDGATPASGLIRDSSGNLYGETVEGGDFSNCFRGCGTVYKIDSAGTETVLHSFRETDGVAPQSALLLDQAGNLFGTAPYGGPGDCKIGLHGCGVIFEIVP